MIYFDVTKTGAAGHRSGLTRVSRRLREELDAAVRTIVWREGAWRTEAGPAVALTSDDWLLTAELFSEPERPGFWSFLQTRPCRLAALFHDAIPLKLPQITWPQSAARCPEYLKMLAAFDRVFAISAASHDELTGFWHWQGVEPRARVTTLALGADFSQRPRPLPTEFAETAPPSLVCVGILEPRKNQLFLLEVCESLWAEGLDFALHVVGRVNPQFGRPVVEKIRALAKRGRAVHHHAKAEDATLLSLYGGSRASVFATQAEGCGLPVLESLWLGVPCVCSDLPVLRENADLGGCVSVPLNDAKAWRGALRRVLTDSAWAAELRVQARARRLPTWAESAATLRAGLAKSLSDLCPRPQK
jgi:glycosyltransferase involved in cell wall biosynthesis